MRLVTAPTLAPSKRPTALHLETYAAKPGRGVVDALWFDKKKGTRLVRTGVVAINWNVWYNQEDWDLISQTLTLSEVLALPRCDFKYLCNASWDGENLWAQSKVEPAEKDALVAVLDGMLTQGDNPSVPGGWLGWYNLVDSESYPGLSQ